MTLPANPSPEQDAQPLCASHDIEEGGTAHIFDVLEFGQPARAFVVRFEGQVVGYINRCAHVPAEMDWLPGQFFDESRRWLLCSIHGAMYDPANGHCVAGPCVRGRLKAIRVHEQDGQVYWYPSQHVQPVFPA